MYMSDSKRREGMAGSRLENEWKSRKQTTITQAHRHGKEASLFHHHRWHVLFWFECGKLREWANVCVQCSVQCWYGTVLTAREKERTFHSPSTLPPELLPPSRVVTADVVVRQNTQRQSLTIHPTHTHTRREKAEGQPSPPLQTREGKDGKRSRVTLNRNPAQQPGSQ